MVTVASTAGLNIGDTFMFSGLASATGVSNSTLYFITSISGATFQYSTTAGGGAIINSSAGSGIAYVDQGPSGYYATDKNGVVSPHVDVFQTYRFSMAPTRGVFAAQPSAGQEVSWIKELVQYNTFPGHNQLLRMQFEFKVQTAIAGTIYNDFEDDGLLDSFDTGLKGVTVFLDDNNNGVLDAGEQSTVTEVDGTYLFVHTWNDSDTPASTRQHLHDMGEGNPADRLQSDFVAIDARNGHHVHQRWQCTNVARLLQLLDRLSDRAWRCRLRGHERQRRARSWREGNRRCRCHHFAAKRQRDPCDNGRHGRLERDGLHARRL